MRANTRARSVRSASSLCFAAAAAVCAFQLHAQVDESNPAAQRKARNALISAGDYSSALGVARKIVVESKASQDPKLPTDMMMLARVQGELSDFDDAEQNYLQAAKLLQAAEGLFSPALVAPYQGLGRLYIKEREFPKALTALRQARYVSQRNYGLFNLRQTPLIDDMTTAHLGLGDTVAAEKLQRERLRDALEELGGESSEVIPYRYRLARYYQRSRLLSSARAQLEEVADLREKQGGPQNPRLLEPLRAMTQIDLRLGGKGNARGRLAAVLEANPTYDARERALSEAVLGDWALAHGDLETARSDYFVAYRTLADKDADAARKAFATPRMIDFVEPLSPVDRAARTKPYAWGTVRIRFDVAADGHAANVAIASIEPMKPIGAEYRRRIQETHFRPALNGGKPIATAHVQYRQSFRYYTDGTGDVTSQGKDRGGAARAKASGG